MSGFADSPLYRRLRGAGRPLGEVAPGAVRPALDGGLAAALAVDRPTRDRLVIFDPPTAPLFRPLAAAPDVSPWHVEAADRWIVAVPADLAPGLARFDALTRHLAALPAPADGRDEPWWALGAGQADPPPPPRIVVAGDPPTVAWDETAALVGGPASVIAPADPYWLGLLGSAVGRALLAQGAPAAAVPIPDAPGPARANLGGLALGAADLAGRIAALRRAVLLRLVADFGPPGVPPGPLLGRWWSLDFDQLLAAVRSELRNDIPERFRPTWAQVHADERATHDAAAARLAEIVGAIDLQALAVYGLGEGEAAALGAA